MAQKYEPIKTMLKIDEEVSYKENWWKGPFLQAVAVQKQACLRVCYASYKFLCLKGH